MRAAVGVAALLALAACTAEAPPEGSAGAGAEPPPLTAAEVDRAWEVGRDAAATLQGTLAPRLMNAIQEGGAAHAARFCAGAADSLTGAAAHATGLEVKRTSLRLRNPANAPDRWEEEALRRFDEVAHAGDPLPSGWAQPVSEEEMRFYAPLRVTEVCVSCHGPAEALASGVEELLAEEYPEDRATGYRVGDLRGLIRVSIPRKTTTH